MENVPVNYTVALDQHKPGSAPGGDSAADAIPFKMMKAMHVALCVAHRTENLFYSPCSIDVGLGMLLLGAKGATRDQLMASGVSEDHKERGSLIAHMKGSNQFTLSVASRLFAERSNPLLLSYIKDSEATYGTAVYPLDFKNDPAKACANINKWVAHNTNQKIEELLPSVPSTTRLVLCNAVYFKGMWKDKFDASKTHQQEFKAADGKKITTNFMEKTGKMDLALAPSIKAMVVRLPY
eukprot:GHVN01096959.1.p1 GENE.GHVN01096959.1~~GHVN01096959.1.p1  ORF type:complete len:238 (+),score=32.35 GHVN01096959.1:47-760(+)